MTGAAIPSPSTPATSAPGWPALFDELATIETEVNQIAQGINKQEPMKRMGLVDRDLAYTDPVIKDLLSRSMADIDAATKRWTPGLLQYVRNYYRHVGPMSDFLIPYYVRNCVLSRRDTIILVDEDEVSLLGLLKPDVMLVGEAFTMSQFLADIVDFFVLDQVVDAQRRLEEAMNIAGRRHRYSGLDDVAAHHQTLKDVWADTPEISWEEPFVENSYKQAKRHMKRAAKKHGKSS